MSTSTSVSTQYARSLAPQPPSMHWALVLLLSIFTLSLFGYYWAFRQASFIKKIDPENSKFGIALRAITASFALALFSGLMGILNALTIAHGGEPTHLEGVLNIAHLFQLVTFAAASLAVRNGLVARYGIKMSQVWTLLFNIYYVQYHMSGIARLQAPPSEPTLGGQSVGSVASTRS